jgi:formylglycine-generating enzyme required for sulfatase activity
MTDCGPNRVSCCTSPQVPGGTFDRSYDGISNTNSGNPASVSAFRLDQYEVTVGRFRQFVAAVVGGWRPNGGDGKHTHLNGGQGLSATGGGYESGWDPSWTSDLPTTASAWNTDLASGTWTATAGNSENLPMSHAGWDEAYAFCIWDGGFLPSEAEWNYAAAGGSEQRMFPWSQAYPPGSTGISCAEAWYAACTSTGQPNAVGSESPAGDGKWGQADLAGNVGEYNLDWWGDYVNPCTDCADVAMPNAGGRLLRGGAVGVPAMYGTSGLEASSRASTGTFASGGPGLPRGITSGFRCARAP